MKRFNCVGLVLKGGCREGAYQAGVVAALAERNIEIDVLSGEGIGGLNAAIISTSETSKEAAERLGRIWEELALSLEKDADLPIFLQYCLSAGHRLHYSSTGLRILRRIAKRFHLNLGIDPITGMLEDVVLTDLLKDYLDEEKLATGKPLYAVTFKTSSYLHGLGISLLAATKRISTPPSNATLVQSVNRDVMKQFVLSTASLPLLFKSFRHNDNYHFDGRIGGVKLGLKDPLCLALAGHKCDLIIAPFCHEEMSLPEVAFIGINPVAPLARSFGLTGPMKDYFGLTPNMIEKWKRQGYYETLAVLDVEEKKGIFFEPEKHDVITDSEEKPYSKVVKEIHEALTQSEHGDKQNQP